MDQSTSERYLESKEELQTRMDETRHSMADTVGEIRQELSAAVEWQTYVQRYPGTCLLAGGVFGWTIGRKLASIQDQVPSFTSHKVLPIEPSDPSTLSKMAEKVVSSVFAQVVPIFAGKVRQFIGGTIGSP